MDLNQIKNKVEKINTMFATLDSLSHDELREMYANLRSQSLEKVKSGVPEKEVLDAALVDVFALFKEVARRFATNVDLTVTRTNQDNELRKRCDFVNWYNSEGKHIANTLNYTTSWSVGGVSYKWCVIPYDEQLMGGIALHEGKVIEMCTGEGKTFVSIAPVLLNALVGKSVHVMTANSYLSQRDFEITRPIYSFFGLTVGCIEDKNVQGSLRKKTYQADVIFGSTSRFIFDYLFDMTNNDLMDRVQNKYDFVLLDEADSMLIDEASTPHVISDGVSFLEKKNNKYIQFLPIVKELIAESYEDKLFVKSVIKHSAEYTTEGKKWLREKLQFDQLFDAESLESQKATILSCHDLTKDQKDVQVERVAKQYYECKYLENVLCKLLVALTVYENNVDYVVTKRTRNEKENKIVEIVDENTGRLKESSRWEYGLHEAIEAKEGVNVSEFLGISAVISIKNYLKKYTKLAGMTGTALSCAEELEKVYGLLVQKIPTHRPVIRKDLPLRIFPNQALLDDAAIIAATDLQKEGRPVLVCTSTIKHSEMLARKFQAKGVEVQVLNGKTLVGESKLIANAGKQGCITVATSVAGRGTDIILDEDAKNNGGLAVIGVGIANSIRIDQQLAGRSGRQGDPGTSQFFVSLEDDIVEYLSIDEKERLKMYASSMDELPSDVLGECFVKAQSNCMEEVFKQRAKANLRDDAIDAFRNAIYTNKTRLLKNSNTVDEIISEIDSSNSLVGAFEKCVNGLRDSALPLLRKIQENTYVMREYNFIPLSDGSETYAVPVNFNAALDSQGASLCSEIKSYLLVQAINQSWLQYINEINIESIDANNFADIFMASQKQMLTKLKDMLPNLVLPVSNIENNEKENKQQVGCGILKYFHKSLRPVEMTAPCPCGSGRPYLKCHGATKILS